MQHYPDCSACVMSLTVKAYLHKWWKPEAVEIRRFSVDLDASTSYDCLLRKVAEMFQSVSAEKLDMAWTGKRRNSA